MARAVIGRAGTAVVVPADVCVKSGRSTTDRVIINGSTTPAWVSVLLVFSVVGWLFATANSSRTYRVDVPFGHDLYDRWRRLHWIAWLLATAGIGLAAVAAFVHIPHASALLWLTAAGVVVGVANGLINNVGVREDRDELMLTRIDPAAARAIVESRRRLADRRG